MLEFQKRDTNYEKSSIDLNNLFLTKDVLENINIFLPSINTTGFNKIHGIDLYKNNYEINFRIFIHSFVKLLKINIKNKLIVLEKKLRKFKFP